MNHKIVEKLQKLLALAQNNNQPAEMEAAMLKARQLAMEHDIDLASISSSAEKKSLNIVMKRFCVGKRFGVANDYVCWILKDHFSVAVIYTGSRANGKWISLIGTEMDTEMAHFVYNFLMERFMDCWRGYHETRNCAVGFRTSYLRGLHAGLHEKLGAQKNQLTPEHQNVYGLVLRNKETAIQEGLAKYFPELKAVKKKDVTVDADAYFTGKADGKNISISRPLEMATA